MSLPESLERAATELGGLADQIRPANGDPHRLLEELSPPDAGRLLSWILDQEVDSADELVEAWGESDVGTEILLSISEEGLGKPGRKLLRRARHRLRSQGVVVAAAAAPSPSPRPKAGAEDRWQAAHLSAPDFRGGRMGYLVDSHPSGGARLFEIRFDEGRGILDFKVYNAGRSKVRGFLKSLTRGNAGRLFEVSREALCALIRRASEAQPADRPFPTFFIEWRSRLFPESLAEQPTPGDLVRKALGSTLSEGEASGAIEAVAGELAAGEIGPWPPPTAWVGDWMTKGREAVEGLEGAERAERIDTWLADVTEALTNETDSALLARHLDELAWVRWQKQEDGAAAGLLCVAEAIRRDDPSAAKALSRARVEGLFGPFLGELRVVEESALDSSGTDSDTES